MSKMPGKTEGADICPDPVGREGCLCQGDIRAVSIEVTSPWDVLSCCKCCSTEQKSQALLIKLNYRSNGTAAALVGKALKH